MCPKIVTELIGINLPSQRLSNVLQCTSKQFALSQRTSITMNQRYITDDNHPSMSPEETKQDQKSSDAIDKLKI